MDYPGHAGVLDHLNLTLAPGSYTLIAGPTGSGKSTLALALIGALQAATHAHVTGSCEVMGVEVTALNAAAASGVIAAVWQRPSVQLFRPTVLDEVRSGLDYQRIAADDATGRARAALALVGLAHIPEGRDPMTLSGGEQQRLALAAALVLETPVLVLDEATSALDSTALTQFTAALARARAERELTVVAVDHRIAAHLDHADRVVVLDSGHIALDTTPEELLTRHRTQAHTWGLRLPGADGVAHARARTGAGASNQPTVLESRAAGVMIAGTRLLANVNLALPRGAVALLTGDNGSGKSTLLRLLATELTPSSGRVLPAARSRVRAGIGYAPQRAAELMLTRTVAAELASAVAMGRLGHGESSQVDHLLDVAGLDGLAHSHPLRLSGGQRQRLAVALAVAGSPSMVLLDEPTSGQDRTGAVRVHALVAEGFSQRVTVIATHEPEAFADLATHRFELADGRLREVTP